MIFQFKNIASTTYAQFLSDIINSMNNEELPTTPTQESNPLPEEITKNPNSIGELISIGRDLLTSPDKVYRTVRGEDAVRDLEVSGVVRNAQSAGAKEKSRWGETVFWSKGAEGKYHVVMEDGFVIEAPLAVAQERQVTREDVTAIYAKDSEGRVYNRLESSGSDNLESVEAENAKERKLDEIRGRLDELY